VFLRTALANFGVDHVLDAIRRLWAPKAAGARCQRSGGRARSKKNSAASYSNDSRPTWTPSTATASLIAHLARALRKGHEVRCASGQGCALRPMPWTFFSSEPPKCSKKPWAGDIQSDCTNHGTHPRSATPSPKARTDFTRHPRNFARKTVPPRAPERPA